VVTVVLVVHLQLPEPVLHTVVAAAVVAATQATQVVLLRPVEAVDQVAVALVALQFGMERTAWFNVERTELQIRVAVAVAVHTVPKQPLVTHRAVAVTAVPESSSFAMHCQMYQPQTLTLQTIQEFHQLTTSRR
jgi:hypothetical protein